MNQTLHSHAPDDSRRIHNRVALGFDVLWDHSEGTAQTLPQWDGAFEAKGVNLSSGGLAMRVPFLPDVGQRLACKIVLPSASTTPETIVAGTEVVWAASHGQRLGEVGLRFIDLPSEHESLLESLLRGRYRPPTPEATMRKTPQTIRVDLDGVSDAIVATVVESDSQGVTVEQPLPFLRIGGQAQLRDETGAERSVRLSAVDLVVEGDMPRLLLDLSYEANAVEQAQRVTRAPATPTESESWAQPSAEMPPALSGSPVVSRPSRSSTAPGIPTPDETSSARMLQGQPVVADPDDTVPDLQPPMAESEFEGAQYTAQEQHSEQYFEQQPSGVSVRQPSGLHTLPEVNAFDSDLVAATEEEDEYLAAFAAQTTPFDGLLDKGRAVLRAAYQVLLQVWSAARVKTQEAGVLGRLTGGAQVLAQNALRGLRRSARTVGRLLPGPARRRTSAFPDGRPRKAQAATAAAPAQSKRKWIGPTLVGFGVLLAIYALWPSSEVEVDDAAMDAADGEQMELSVEDSFIDSEPAAFLPEPAAAEPALPEPTLIEAANETFAEALQPTSKPEFGSARVGSARTYRLRMSRPIERLEGRTDDSGFIVRIPGSLSLDRAGPISASHPLVKRSMILNHGDYAELTIQFGAKGSPAYRVRGVGSELELLIGTRAN